MHQSAALRGFHRLLPFSDAPVCAPGQRVQYAVTLHETTQVSCRVEAVPSEVTYRWQFNSSLETLDLPFSMVSFRQKCDRLQSIVNLTYLSLVAFY